MQASSCIDEDDDLEVRAMGPERLRHFELTAQGADRPASPRVEQIGGGPECADRDAPDQEIVVAFVAHFDAKEADRRNAGEPGVPAKEFEVAEQEIETGPPGDRREGQVVTLHPKRDEADGERQGQRQCEADCETDPWRHRIASAQDCRRVRTDTDERRLAERCLARDAGQEHQAQRDDAVEANVIAERHPELRSGERHTD
jgi:hypothetical protein